jgi:hypothetical protein
MSQIVLGPAAVAQVVIWVPGGRYSFADVSNTMPSGPDRFVEK